MYIYIYIIITYISIPTYLKYIPLPISQGCWVVISIELSFITSGIPDDSHPNSMAPGEWLSGMANRDCEQGISHLQNVWAGYRNLYNPEKWFPNFSCHQQKTPIVYPPKTLDVACHENWQLTPKITTFRSLRITKQSHHQIDPHSIYL